MKNILVTGGVGFIGSHTVVELVESGFSVTVIDNLQNSFYDAFVRMQELVGEKKKYMKFIKVDLKDLSGLDSVFESEKFDAVVHFAAMKAVGESMEFPLLYYKNNALGTINLIDSMSRHGCKTLVFSSSCTVYGNPTEVPITEDHPRSAISVYGRTKLLNEDIMMDVANADKEWKIILLRYFNPVSAHPSGKIGEHPIGVPNNLMPYVQQVAVGIRPELSVFGDDYETRDGTCIRDYIHVMDLAVSHVAALNKVLETEGYGCQAVNVGTGNGTTVFEMIKAFEEASGKKIPFKVVGRRAGDSVAVWAATKRAEEELGWKAKYDIKDMCRDQWKWATDNPKGYES
eukprot:g5348.t1